MLEAIRRLGYRPSLAASLLPLEEDESPSVAPALPALVREAVDEAAAAGRHVLLDFRAAWCGACRTLERTTLADPRVVHTLNSNFVVRRVDTDEHPGIARQFEIVGLPTLLVLDGNGRIVYRHAGPIEAPALLEALATLPGH